MGSLCLIEAYHNAQSSSLHTHNLVTFQTIVMSCIGHVDVACPCIMLSTHTHTHKTWKLEKKVK